MYKIHKGDEVKHASYPFNFKVLKVFKKWATCEGMNEHGKRVLEDFSTDFLEVVTPNPKMNISKESIEFIENALAK